MSTQPSWSADDGRPAASAEYEGPAEDDRRSFTTGIGSMVDPAVDEPAVDDDDLPPLQPTFTARSDEPATVSPVPEPAPAPDDATASDDAATPVDTGTLADPAPVAATAIDTVPVIDTVPESTAASTPVIGPDDGAVSTGAGIEPDAVYPADQAPDVSQQAASQSSTEVASPDWDRTQARPTLTPAGLDEPLLSDAAGLRLRWQQVQAGFVDDPQEAVGEAADMIEQSAQALVSALRQRQRELRVQWERGPGGADTSAADTRGANGGSGSAQAGGVPDTEHLRLMMQRYRALFNQLVRP
jgi:hypothetical protein